MDNKIDQQVEAKDELALHEFLEKTENKVIATIGEEALVMLEDCVSEITSHCYKDKSYRINLPNFPSFCAGIDIVSMYLYFEIDFWFSKNSRMCIARGFDGFDGYVDIIDPDGKYASTEQDASNLSSLWDDPLKSVKLMKALGVLAKHCDEICTEIERQNKGIILENPEEAAKELKRLLNNL